MFLEHHNQAAHFGSTSGSIRNISLELESQNVDMLSVLWEQGGPLHRTISAPPLASAQPQRCLKESLFDFTSIFDGDGLSDSPPSMHKRPTVCNIHATSASDVRPLTTSRSAKIEQSK